MNMYPNVKSEATAAVSGAAMRVFSNPMASNRDDMYCRYQSKHCTNGRSLKPNGKYHSLCLSHRASANINQRKLDRKKRKFKIEMTPHAKRTSQLAPMHRQARICLPITKEPLHMAGHPDLTRDDLSFLVDSFPPPHHLAPLSDKKQDAFALHGSQTHHSLKPPANEHWQSFLNESWKGSSVESNKHRENYILLLNIP